MVKIVRTFCILGIVALLGIFIVYTEFEGGKEVEKEISEIENQEQLDKESFKAEVDDSRVSLCFDIISLF